LPAFRSDGARPTWYADVTPGPRGSADSAWRAAAGPNALRYE